MAQCPHHNRWHSQQAARSTSSACRIHPACLTGSHACVHPACLTGSHACDEGVLDKNETTNNRTAQKPAQWSERCCVPITYQPSEPRRSRLRYTAHFLAPRNCRQTQPRAVNPKHVRLMRYHQLRPRPSQSNIVTVTDACASDACLYCTRPKPWNQRTAMRLLNTSHLNSPCRSRIEGISI